MELFLALVLIVFGILQLILFFKIWGMTDNISKLTNYVGDITDDVKKISIHFVRPINNVNLNKDNSPLVKEGRFYAKQLVCDKKTGSQMRVVRNLENGDIECIKDNLHVFVKKPQDIVPFEEYTKKPDYEFQIEGDKKTLYFNDGITCSIKIYPDLQQRSIRVGDEEIIYKDEDHAVKAAHEYATKGIVLEEGKTFKRKWR